MCFIFYCNRFSGCDNVRLEKVESQKALSKHLHESQQWNHRVCQRWSMFQEKFPTGWSFRNVARTHFRRELDKRGCETVAAWTYSKVQHQQRVLWLGWRLQDTASLSWHLLWSWGNVEAKRKQTKRSSLSSTFSPPPYFFYKEKSSCVCVWVFSLFSVVFSAMVRKTKERKRKKKKQ